MSLLDFARGPALQTAIAVCVAGCAWRLAGILLQPAHPDRSPARAGAWPAPLGALYSIMRRMWPRRNFVQATLFTTLNGYVFHFGLALVVFGLAAHIVFVRSLIGVGWTPLPSNFVYGVGVVTLGSLTAALARRMTHPVGRLLSGADDYLSWTLTAVPVLTGLMATSHLGARYETLLAIHLLSVEALLLWFPFGKLMHAVLFAFSRGASGVRFSHRGVRL